MTAILKALYLSVSVTYIELCGIIATRKNEAYETELQGILLPTLKL